MVAVVAVCDSDRTQGCLRVPENVKLRTRTENEKTRKRQIAFVCLCHMIMMRVWRGTQHPQLLRGQNADRERRKTKREKIKTKTRTKLKDNILGKRQRNNTICSRMVGLYHQ